MYSKKFIDLTGMHLGYYDVLGEAPPRIQPSGKVTTMWYCRCVCGKINIVEGGHLRNRPNISCGCIKKTTLIDLTGQTYNWIFVKNRAEDRRKSNGKFTTMWNCKCLLCGKMFIETGYKIKNGIRKSCGCISSKLKSESHLIDLTNTKHGRLLVKSRSENYNKPCGSTETMWNCICECGNECVKSRQYLLNSPYPSCNCWKKEIMSALNTKNIIGKIFGWLIPEERLPNKITAGGNSKVMYKCKCINCGSYTDVSAGNLVSGQVKSCGCIKSIGEKSIKEYLNKHSILHKTQYHFSDLYLTDPQWMLMFDFALLDKDGNILCLIEYQGKQHYYEQPSNPQFGKQQRDITDDMKKEYCFAHNIPLEEIRYDEDVEYRMNTIITTYVNPVPSSKEKV